MSSRFDGQVDSALRIDQDVDADVADVGADSAPVGGVAKRLVDIVLASLGLATFLWLFGLVSLLVLLSDGKPVFYPHARIGRGQRLFLCLKFRTMVVDSPHVLSRHLETSPAAAEEWAKTRKLKNDPRVTRVGAVLRKLSIDELPQLINVLRGEMSMVGPRPIVADEIRMYGSDAHYYFQARPGLTGAWQASRRNNEFYGQRVALDRDYVENWSMWKDIWIIAKTIPAVLTARGSC